MTLPRHPLLLAIGLGAVMLALAGCAPTLPVVVQSVQCPDAAQVLARRCAAPQAVPDNATYGAVLELHQADRKALRDCAAQQAALVQQVSDCQRALKDYNDKLGDLNRRIANPP